MKPARLQTGVQLLVDQHVACDSNKVKALNLQAEVPASLSIVTVNSATVECASQTESGKDKKSIISTFATDNSASSVKKSESEEPQSLPHATDSADSVELSDSDEESEVEAPEVGNKIFLTARNVNHF